MILLPIFFNCYMTAQQVATVDLKHPVINADHCPRITREGIPPDWKWRWLCNDREVFPECRLVEAREGERTKVRSWTEAKYKEQP